MNLNKRQKLLLVLGGGAIVLVLLWLGGGAMQLKESAAGSKVMARTGGGAEMMYAPSSPSGAMAGASEAPREMAKSAMQVAQADSSADGDGRQIVSAQFKTVASSTQDRYLIRNGSISIEVKDVKVALDKLTEATKVRGGYVGTLTESTDGLGVRTVTVEVRLPAQQFEATKTQLEGMGKVKDQSVSAEDVTEEFVDSQARLRNLNRTELRLLAHLDKTGKMSDTLLVERELGRIRQESEQIEGRLRFLSNRVKFSSLTVTISGTPGALPIQPVDTYSSARVATDASRSLLEFAQGVWARLIWLGIWAVVWLPLGIVVLVVGRRVYRATATPKATA